jgi:hypothetical protein
MEIIAATDGLNKAADLLEEAFRLKAIAVSGTQAA